MKKIQLIYLILFLAQLYAILTEFNAVYRIDSTLNNNPLKIENNRVIFSNKKDGKEESFRIFPTDDGSNLYYIISKIFNKKVGVNDDGEILLYNIDDVENNIKTKWNIYKFDNIDYVIQNSYNQKYMEIKEKTENRKSVKYPICKSTITDKFLKSFKYSFFKLCEEVQIKPEHIEIIEKEPIDVLYKYIDLTDNTLNRKGISQIKKDEDNEELRYSIRGILQYIPWIRNIVILMPNEKVKYFKPINEINNKIVYVKDIDMLGFDSADSVTFQLNLGNMRKFGLSENFILMDDDYFIGKPIKKTQFFYYDENLKKVVPSVVTDDFTEMIRNDIMNEYKKYHNRRNRLKPHAFEGWKYAQLNSFLLLLNNFSPPLVNAGFSHNAIPLNLDDLIEIHDFIVNKYEYAKEVMTSKIRTVCDLQPQSLFNSYALNVKKRKVSSIPSVYYDLVGIEGRNLDIELFVINTSGDRSYSSNHYKKEREALNKKYPIPTPFEIDYIDTLKGNNKLMIDLNGYVKRETCLQKEDFEKLKKNLENVEKNNKELNDKVERSIKEKNYIENKLKQELYNILKDMKNITYNESYLDKSDYNFNDLEKKEKEKENQLLEKIYYYKKLFIIMLSLFLILLISIICCYKRNYKGILLYNKGKEIQMTALASDDNENTNDNTFSTMKIDE